MLRQKFNWACRSFLRGAGAAPYFAWGRFRDFVSGHLCCTMERDAAPRALHGITSAIDLQRGNEGFLRDVDLAELPHLLLAFLLLLQKLALTRDVAAVALCGDVLAQRAHGLARDHLAADRRLDWDLEHVRRDQLLHLLDHGAAAPLS